MNLTELAMSYKFVKQTSGGGSGGSANNGGGVKVATFATLDEVTQFLITNNKAITHKLMYNGIICITGDGVPEETFSNSISATIDTNVTPDFAAVSYNFYTAVDQLSLTYASDAGELYLVSGIYNLLGTVYMEVTPDFSEVSEWTLYYFDESTSSGGGASGGLPIKKIEFTDRPTAWEWLKSNYHKAIKATLSASIMPVALIYNTFSATYDLDTNEITSICLTAMSPDTIAENGVNYLHRLLEIAETGTTALTGANSIALKTTPTITMDGVQPQTLPDVYWAQLSASLTVYYIE